jgi:hypothetical protein
MSETSSTDASLPSMYPRPNVTGAATDQDQQTGHTDPYLQWPPLSSDYYHQEAHELVGRPMGITHQREGETIHNDDLAGFLNQ